MSSYSFAGSYASSSAYASTPRTAYAYASSSNEDSDDDEELHPWEKRGWVPTTKTGKQITPNTIRNQLQKYIDESKANGTGTQTSIIDTMGVNSNTFRRFMNPKTYKNQWSAVDNGTYWAAAKLLERVKWEKAENKKREKLAEREAKKAAKAAAKAGGKRKASSNSDEDIEILGVFTGGTKKVKTAAVAATASKLKPKTKAEKKLEAQALISKIQAIDLDDERVFDSCPQLVKKIKTFLEMDGVSKAMLLDAWGGVNSNSLNTFLSGKKQDQCGNCVYPLAYRFFEKQRIMEGKKKSAARMKNEREQPRGFSLVKDRGFRWVFTGR